MSMAGKDSRWLICLRDLVSTGVSVADIIKEMEYAPCWEVTDCSVEKRNSCAAFQGRNQPGKGMNSALN